MSAEHTPKHVGNITVNQGCTNDRRQLNFATAPCIMARDILGSSVWKLLCVNLLTRRHLGCKMCGHVVWEILEGLIQSSKVLYVKVWSAYHYWYANICLLVLGFNKN